MKLKTLTQNATIKQYSLLKIIEKKVFYDKNLYFSKGNDIKTIKCCIDATTM
jgi:hypothetical protein